MTTISTSPPSSANDGVAERLHSVRLRIEQAGGDPSAVRVVAVTKGFGPEAVVAARAAGLHDIGENYADELVAKAAELGDTSPSTTWHFLGAIQRNKVARLAPIVGMWQSVSRVEEGARIARFAPDATVLVEVDTTGLPERNGCPPDAVRALVPRLRDAGLDVRGLMTVAAPGPGAAASAFDTVRSLADELGLVERSMGMTDDLEAAVRAGTTMVRIGRALFGERPAKRPV
ncbi:MAG TPA: alanine racemase [Acidimicrobiales bacterium]|nr:alanine racemase [Acidimicrobiales bacterium]